jgi:elongation factor G
MAFKVASIAAFKEAMQAAKPAILEPIMTVEVTAPEEFQGSIIGQLNQRRGVIMSTETAENYVTAVAEIPLNMMFGYSTDLRSATQGKGEFTMEFCKYQAVPKFEQDTLIAEHQKKKAAEGK